MNISHLPSKSKLCNVIMSMQSHSCRFTRSGRNWEGQICQYIHISKSIGLKLINLIFLFRKEISGQSATFKMLELSSTLDQTKLVSKHFLLSMPEFTFFFPPSKWWSVDLIIVNIQSWEGKNKNKKGCVKRYILIWLKRKLMVRLILTDINYAKWSFKFKRKHSRSD